MKLMRNNKYKGYMLSMVTVIALMSGCGKNEYSPVISEPVQTIEATVETKPIVNTTVATEPIVEESKPDLSKSMPDYTEEELIEKINELRIIEDDEVYNSYKYNVIILENTITHKYKILFTMYNKTENGFLIRDAFTDEELFIMHTDSVFMRYSDDVLFSSFKDDPVYPEYINSNFEKYRLVYSDTVTTIGNIGIYIFDDKDNLDELYNRMNEIFDPDGDKYTDTSDFNFTREELAKIYVTMVPEYYRVKAEDLKVEKDKVSSIGTK